ncbi:uncharacterized protein [Elaeis guineensis]|uniref:Uncharacterized protein LOC105059451 n=1 Tax=Elaeis guineensis var. tenera TaxID=51953 RepID=A0A6I9SBN3_ELAGV|nr:uncharacterized protein LOC105059451 [Elaeis guineensis]
MEQPPNSTKAKTNSSSSSNNSKPPKAKKISISILVISLPLLYVSLLHISPSTLFKDTTFWFLMSNSIIIIIAADSGVFSSSTETGDLYEEFIKHSRARSASLVAEPPPKTTIIESPKELVLAPSQLDVTADKNIVVRENSVLQLDKPVNKRVVAKERSLPHPEVEVDRSIVVYEKPLHQSMTEKKDHHRLPLRRSVTGRRNQHSFMGSGHSVLPLHRSITETRNHQYLEENEYSKLSDEELNERVEEFIKRFNREIRLQLRNE